MTVIAAEGTAVDRPMSSEEKRVIFASSLGTVFEWYDFYCTARSSAIIAKQFFSGVNQTSGIHLRAAGVRGRLRRAAVRRAGVRPPRRPDRAQVHVPGHHRDHGRVDLPRRRAAELRDDRRRRADHPDRAAPAARAWRSAANTAARRPTSPNTRRTGKRGFYTSWIQTTATLGLFLSLLVILGCRAVAGREASKPGAGAFRSCCRSCCSASRVWIRLQLNEVAGVPGDEGGGQDLEGAAHARASARWGNLKIVLLALFGATAGQAVVWYTGQFYALFFLTQTLKVDATAANLLIAAALLHRHAVLHGVRLRCRTRSGASRSSWPGCLLAALTYFPIFKGLTHYANPALERRSDQRR